MAWRARCENPDTGEEDYVWLDPAAEGRTPETRKAWAVSRSEDIEKRRWELKGGAPRASGSAVAHVMKRYYDDNKHLAKTTLDVYRGATDKFEAWCAGEGRVSTIDDLTLERLAAFFVSIKDQGRLIPARGKGKRGQRKESGARRSENTVNKEVRAMRTVLKHLRGLGLLPKLVSAEQVNTALKKMKTGRKRIVFLKPADCQRLLVAALSHDRKCFAETRAEHRGEGQKGATAIYVPIAPFVLFVLLTGMRPGEALAIEWKEVDLDACDVQGRPVGELHLEKTKTNFDRTVVLEVSPALRRLIVLLKERRVKRPKHSEWSAPVFDLNADLIDAAMGRLRDEFGAPKIFSYQVCRSTCATFLSCAPGIFGSAAPFRSATQLGHSVTVAQKHYVGLLNGISPDAKSLEAAMGIEDLAEQVLATLEGDRKSHGALEKPIDRSTLN